MQAPSRQTPFFSVVIPTKNRSFLVGNAIQSVLRQTFPDLELIVADNDDTDATRKVVETSRDPRLKYLRTGNLNMPDNWEAGASQARGEYVLMLEDKQALKFGALEQVFKAVEGPRPTTVKWLSDSFSDSILPPRVRLARGGGSPEMVSSEVILDHFTNDPGRNFKQTLPLPQLGCYHRSLAAQIKSGVMGRLFHPVTPDVIFGLLQLAYGAGVFRINQALVVYMTSRHSNGKSVSMKGALAKNFTTELGGKDSIYYDRVPIKAVTVPGIVYNDYLKIQSLVQGRLVQFPVNWCRYFVECHHAMVTSWENGVDMSGELKAWQAALDGQPESLRREVADALAANGVKPQPGIQSKIKRLMKRAGLLKFERAAKCFVRGKLKGEVEWRFANGMEYLEWDGANSARR